jgi:hypothetical protein
MQRAKSRVFQRDTVHKEGAALACLDSGLLLTVRGSDRALDHNGIMICYKEMCDLL